MATDTVTEVLRGELERLFDLDEMMRISIDVLGFQPETIGGTSSKSAYARALVGYCSDQEAIEALVDAIILSSVAADGRLRSVIKALPNGELRPGTRVGPLRIVKKIGEGGMSVVYLAEGDTESGEVGHAALKVIRPQFARDRAAVHRFTAVSRVMQSLQSPSLASVLAVGQLEDARPWVAATYMAGQTLAQRIKRSRALHISEARSIFLGVLAGLLALHERGLLHGDIKAENVFLKRASGHELTGILVDAGGDRLFGRGPLGANAVFMPALGSAKAVAPEQARGLEPDPRSDVYQMGTLIYETLTGRPPFIGESAMDVIAQHLCVAPAPPSTHAPNGWVSPALDEFVLRALCKEPQQRFANIAEFIDELERAVRKPAVQRAFDPQAFEALRELLFQRPADTSVADRIERMAEQAGEIGHAAQALEEAASLASDSEAKVELLLRVARLCETELRDSARAERIYQQIREFAPDNDIALRGLEAIKRASSDHEGLIFVLLDRVENERDLDARRALLHEVATLYEKELRDTDRAFLAWSHALLSDPSDPEAQRQIERLAGQSEARWDEVLSLLNESAQHMHAVLFGGEQSRENVARRKLEQAQARLHENESELSSALALRNQELAAERARTREQLRVLEDELEHHRADHRELLASLKRDEDQLRALGEAAKAEQAIAREVRQQAHLRVQAYEKLEDELGGEPTPERQSELSALAAEAEALVLAAEQAELSADAAHTKLEAARAEREQREQAIKSAAQLAAQTEQAVVDQRALVNSAPAAAEYTETEQAGLTAARRAVAAVRGEIEALERRDSAEVAAQRERDLAHLVQTHVTMGHWYSERLARRELAIGCYSQALALDEHSDQAYDGMAGLYRGAQAWPELVTTLLRRAEQGSNPVKSRDYRTEAAGIIFQHQGDQSQARAQLERVLAADPDHLLAGRLLEQILREQQDHAAYAARLEWRAPREPESERVALLLALGELYEGRLAEPEKAAAKYQAALELQPRELRALKGLEHVYAKDENYEGLLRSLSAQIELAPTPKQRIGLLERVGLLLEGEFVDHAQAARRFEEILAIDAGHEGANTALSRIYRHLRQFESLVTTLMRHAGTCSEPHRKIELLLQAARTLGSDCSAPERAIELYDSVLALDETQPEALSELARLKTMAGDHTAALAAIERLADQEHEPQKQAQLWIRAGRLLEGRGEADAAIARYKRALDADRQASEASEALRAIYEQRGDAHGAVDMLLRALESAQGELKRAALLGELGMLYRDRLARPGDARAAFEQALSLDRTSSAAAAGLLRIASTEQRWNDVATYFELLLPRLSEFALDQAAELCGIAAHAYQQTAHHHKAAAALARACELLPDDLEYAERHAMSLLDSGDAARGAALYQQILERFADRLADRDRLRLLRAYGQAQLQGEDHEGAVDTLGSILDQAPADSASLEALTRAHEQAKNWSEVINLLQLRVRGASDEDERFELLVKTGDVFLEQIGDREAAAQTFAMALDVKPDNRNLLTKLMTIYSDAQDWPRVIEVIVRIAEMVKDPIQFAKYYNTAATIAHRQLGRFDEAATYYQEALSKLPAEEGDVQFAGLVQCLTENQDWERLERAYELRISRLREAGAAKSTVAAMLDQCGEIVQHRLGRLGSALQLFEEALGLEPDDEKRRQRLTAIYTKEPKRFFERAVSAHRHYLAADPQRVESLQALRRVYTSARKADEAWCMCQALRCLGAVDPDEEAFFKKYRLTRLPRLKQHITEELWRELVIHPAQDVTLTSIFATLQPAVIASQGQSLSAFGLGDRDRVDGSGDAAAMDRMLVHVMESTNAPAIPMYRCAHDPGGLSFVFTVPPAIGIGEGAKAGGPQQALAFVAARHLSYYRAGHFTRQLVPTGTGLRAWLVGAIRSIAPRFPAPTNMEEQVRQCAEAIARHLSAPQRDTLRSITQKLLEAAPELDMKAWMAGLDLSADRIGFVLSNDLKIANAVVEASPEDASSVSRKDRVRELLAYSVSEPYLELRKRIGIALG